MSSSVCTLAPVSTSASARLGVTMVARGMISFCKLASASGCSRAVAARRYHDGVNHQKRQINSPHGSGDGADNVGGKQHTGLGGADGNVGGHGTDLGCHDVGINGLYGINAAGILRRNGRDGAGAVHAESRECLEIRLDSGAAAGIRTGDGEGCGCHGAVILSFRA